MYIQHWFRRLSWLPEVKYIFLQFSPKIIPLHYRGMWSKCKKMWKLFVQARLLSWLAPDGSDWPEERYVAPPFLRAVPGLRHTVTSYQITKPANYQPSLNSRSLINLCCLWNWREIEEKCFANVKCAGWRKITFNCLNDRQSVDVQSCVV